MSQKKDSKWFDKRITEIQSSFSTYLNVKSSINPHAATLKIITIYIIIGSLWIMLSDSILSSLIIDTKKLASIQTYKGWFYVFITGLIFYFIIFRKIFAYKTITDKMLIGYEQLSATHEELLAMDEELTQQFQELEKSQNALMKSEQRYSLAVEGANDGIWEWDFENDTYFSSLKWKEVFGYRDEEVPKKFNTWKKLLHPEDSKRVKEIISKYLDSMAGIYETTYRLRCKDGKYRWILSRGKGIWDSKGDPLKIAGSHTDITDFVDLQDKIHRGKELYGSVINGAAVFIVGVDNDENIIEFNPFAENLTGYKKSEVMGKKWTDLFIPDESKKYTKSIISRTIDDENIINQENKIITKAGCIKDILWNNNAIHDREGNVLGAIAVGADITDRKSMEKELVNLAYCDQLTGLANRQKFEILLEERINIAKDMGEKFALLYLDLDDFKKVNDTYGHSYGDILLKNIAEVLKTNIPGVVARLSGDEFAIIISSVMDTIEFHSNIISIMELISREWVIKGHEFYITSSLGIAIYPDDGKDIQTLFKNADTAMYTAKDNSKNCYAFYTSEMHDKTLKALSMEKGLRSALLNDEFFVHYQPIIDFRSGEIIGLEALVRWSHPEKGLIPPMEFIPFAEETGLIVDIGEVIIIKVCEQLKKWCEMGLNDVNISINLSAIQLRHHNFINRIIDISEKMGINGANLTFEITENVALHDLSHTIKIIEMLKSMNIKVALDDFGTGYSSLNYLQKLPIDIIKIDRAFIKDITKNSNEEFIAKTIIELSHNMKYLVTAEGIETLEQLRKLEGFGCDFAQGYLFSKPISADEIEHLLLSKKTFNL